MMKRLVICYSVLVLFLFPVGSASIAGNIFFDDFDDYTGSIPWKGEGYWTVIEDSVDLIGEGTSWDLLPGNGLYLDMDGSTDNAGTIESISIELVPGNYVLSYDVAGNHRNGGDDSIDVLVGGGVLVNTTTTVGQDVPLTTVSIPFTVADVTTTTISFDGIGSDNSGLLLDNVGLATYDAMGTTIGEDVSFEVPFISQIDHRWADMKMLGQDLDGDPQTVDYNPEDVNYAECGSALAAVSMVLEYYHESSANWLGLSPVPPHVDDFLYQYGAHRTVTGGTGCSAVEVDMSPLMYWDKEDFDGSSMYSGLRLESRPWGIVSRMRLDADLKESKPHILEVDGPLSSGGTKTGLNTHYLVVAGWDEEQQSYLVHDPLLSSSEVYWNASYRINDTLYVPAISPTGAIYAKPQMTLHDLYYGKNPNVEPGALNVITRVIFVEDVFSSETSRALKVYAACPVELYASDPDGKRIGIDPVTGSHVQGADAYYYTQGGANPFNETCCNNLVKVIEFPRPIEGRYLIQVVGTDDGPFNLFFNTGDVTFDGQTSPGQINKYELEYSQDGVSCVETANFLPDAHAVSSTTSARAGVPISFSGLTSGDFDGQIISYDWDFGDGTAATGAAVEHVYTAAGNFTVVLTVEDDLGGTTTDEVEISIIGSATKKDPEPPSVMIVREEGDGSIVNLAPFLGLASTGPGNRALVNFIALGIDPTYGQEEDWKWTWDFGDGSAPIESSYWADWSGGVSGAAHEYAEPGTYIATVVFNNGIEDSTPAAAQVEILPVLDRGGERFSIDGSCYSAGDQIRADGRFAYTDIPELWDGGFALGEKPLESWLNFYYEDNLHPLYYFLISEVSEDVPRDGWILGGIRPELPDLSFDYTFSLPDDLPEGEYEAVFVAARDLYGSDTTWQEWPTAELPLMIEGMEVTSKRIPFVVSCPEPKNYLPVADAGGPYEANVGEPVTLDGTGSYDPDGNNEALKFKWFPPISDFTEPIDVPLPLEGPNPRIVFEEPGVYIVTLAVEDERGGISYSTIGSPGSFAIVRVDRWPSFEDNHPPIADAGDDQIIEQDSHAGGSVVIDGRASFDLDGDPLTYTWFWDGGFNTGNVEVLNAVLPLGTTTVTLVVNDGMTDSEPNTVDITVQDTIVPFINDITTTPSVITPANWGMTPVTVNVDAGDIGDPAPACYVTGVEGPTVGEQDWELTDDPLVVLLRARTIGSSQELVYTIHVTCEDHSGNITTGTVNVTVPVSGDMVPPVIHSITATPNVLTPPNWSMRTVTVNVDASDERDPAPDCYITGIEATSNDEDDWELTGDPLVVMLRARTIGSSGEQVYTIHVACEDNSGNISTGTVDVTVPVP